MLKKLIPSGQLNIIEDRDKEQLDESRHVRKNGVVSLWSFSLIGLFLGLSSCSFKKQETANLAKIYNRAAQSHGPLSNPVIVIPGILGSKIIDPESKRSIWGTFDDEFIDPSKAENLPLIALPLYQQPGEIRGRPDGVLDRLKFQAFGLTLQERAYEGILKALGVGGYLDEDLAQNQVDWGKEHFTCFQFSYDWRLSNAENAGKLHEFILEKKAFVQKRSREIYGEDRKNLKFDIVAHSMGGLVARYYLRYGQQQLPEDGTLPKLSWAGADQINQLIMVGTPNSGSIFAVQELLDGKRLAPDWQKLLFGLNLPSFPPALLATYPSIYELFPRTRHQAILNLADDEPLDFFDVNIWERGQLGILEDSQEQVLADLLPHVAGASERKAIAKSHLNRCLKRAEQFHRALDRPARTPEGLQISLFAGDAINTPRQIKMDLTTNRRFDNDYLPGDGIVLRHSALADERVGSEESEQSRLQSPISFSRVTFLPLDHLGLTQSKTFTDNLLYQLLEKPL